MALQLLIFEAKISNYCAFTALTVFHDLKGKLTFFQSVIKYIIL